MARVLAALATAALALVAGLLAALAVQRARLPYNEEGRYFDAADSVVLTDAAVPVATALAVLTALAALAMLWLTLWLWRRAK